MELTACAADGMEVISGGLAGLVHGLDDTGCLCGGVAVDAREHALPRLLLHLGFERVALLLESGDLLWIQVAGVLSPRLAGLELAMTAPSALESFDCLPPRCGIAGRCR